MKEIARFYDPEEAKVAAGFLRSQGYEITLPEEHHLGSAPHLSFALGGYRLLAPYEEAYEASLTLRQKRDKPKHDACERCGSPDIRRQRVRWFPFAFLGLVMGTAPFTPAKKKLICSACGFEWSDTDHEP
ncbi:MAG: hypothetical protein AAF225_00425 [Pseudomonadota bacterium]